MYTTFPWKNTLTVYNSPELHSNNISISYPTNDASTIDIMNYCISISWSTFTYYSIFALYSIALCLELCTLLPEELWRPTTSSSILSKECRFEIVGTSIGVSSGIVFASWRGMITAVNWVRCWVDEQVIPYFYHGWCDY